MILVSRPWNYSPDGWEKFFLPVSECRADDAISGTLPVFTNASDAASHAHPAMVYPFFPSPTPAWSPFAVPRDVLDRLGGLHEQPSLWWIGQGLAYLWRLQPNVTKTLDEEAKRKDFRKPIVGWVIKAISALWKRHGATLRRWIPLSHDQGKVVLQTFYCPYDDWTNFWPLQTLEKKGHVQSPEIFLPEKGLLGPDSGTARPKLWNDAFLDAL